jgi:hypothetical protein
MSIDAVALLAIEGWEPNDELDVRELEDGSVLLFLELPFDAEDDDLIDAIDDATEGMLLAHADDRGIFVLPDAAEPEGAETYDAVVEAAQSVGRFLSLEAFEEQADLGGGALEQMLGGEVRSLLDGVVGAMGFSSVEEMKSLLESNDPEAMKLAQIKMSGAIEQAMSAGLAAAPSTPAASTPSTASTPSSPLADGGNEER